jgi:hypothetical protein
MGEHQVEGGIHRFYETSMSSQVLFSGFASQLASMRLVSIKIFQINVNAHSIELSRKEESVAF